MARGKKNTDSAATVAVSAGASLAAMQQVHPELKSEPIPELKAEPKLELKPKAEAKAKAEPVKPKATAKPKSKAKDVTAAPSPGAASTQSPAASPSLAPTPSADVPEAATKKKRKVRGKKVEVPAEEAPLEPEMLGPSQQELDVQQIKSEHDSYFHELTEKICKEFEALPDLRLQPPEDVMKDVNDQRKTLEKMLSDIDETLKTVKIPRPKNTNTGKIMEQMRELRMCKDDGTFTETNGMYEWRSTKQQILGDVENALSKSLAFDSFRTFQNSMVTLKTKCNEKIKDNDVIAKTVRNGNMQRRILNRVAMSKGIKVEDLHVDEVVSINVDLIPEVISLLYLYQRKFEKQYGVIVDRVDGAKAGGKGTAGSVKNLTVRGLEAEAASCAAALKALDFSDRKMVNAPGRLLGAIMGHQQSNARKIEQDFKGVFLHTEKNQVWVYGPKKEVAACVKHLQTITEEDNSVSPTLEIDKDVARALIGAEGRTVQKFEAETGTSIRVQMQREDENMAQVRIIGEKAEQLKAREVILNFTKSLTKAIVEAEPGVVQRLYDGAVRSKFKGKGKSKGEGGPLNGATKFSELQNFSGLTVVRKAKAVLLVGDERDVNAWKAVLEECVQEASNVPMTVRLDFEQARFWTPERVEGVCQASRAKVAFVKRPREPAVLELVGTEAEKVEAQSAIIEINKQFGFVEAIEDVSPVGVRSLIANYAAKAKDIETKHDVVIAVDRKSQSVKIVGGEDSVMNARKAIETILVSAENTTVREIDIEWDEGRVVIGKGGNMVWHIKQTTGLEDLQVEDSDQKKKVVFRGSEEAVDQAVVMVQEAITKAKSSGSSGFATHPRREQNTGVYAAVDVTAAASEGHKQGASAASTATAKEQPQQNQSVANAPPVGGQVSVNRSGQNTFAKKVFPTTEKVDVNLESKVLFPVLGASTDGSKGGKKGMKWPGISVWKVVDQSSVDEEPPTKLEEE